MCIDNTSVEKLTNINLLTVTPETDVTDAADILLNEGVGSLVALDAEDHLAGVLTSTNFVGVVSADHSPYTDAIRDYIVENILTVLSPASIS